MIYCGNYILNMDVDVISNSCFPECPRGFIEHDDWCYWVTWQLEHQLSLDEYKGRCQAINWAETQAQMVVVSSLSDLAFWRYMWHM